MTEIQSLYQRIEDQYAKIFSSEQTNPNIILGRVRYAEHESIASTFELAQEYLSEAREQAELPDCEISEQLIALYGQLTGYCKELLAHRDFDSLVLLLALAKLEPSMEVERSLSCAIPVLDAIGGSIYYLNHDSITRDFAKSNGFDRVAQIQRYYTIDGGLQKNLIGDDGNLFARLSEWAEELHTYQYDAQL